MLRIEVQELGSNVILHCFGRMVRGEGLDRLRQSALGRNPGNLAIDLRNVSGVDAGGLGLLAELQQRANASGGNFTLLNPTPRVGRILAATRLNRVLQVVKDPAWQPAFVPSEGPAISAACGAQR